MSRNSEDRMLTGLCGAVARSLNVDPVLIRMGAVFLTVATGLLPGVVTYLFGWLITPTIDQPAPLRRLSPWLRFGPMDWDRAEAEANRKRLAAAVAAKAAQAKPVDS